MSKCIYLDNQATTPCDPRVVEKMLPYFTEKFGNVASEHLYGREVRKACEEARAATAELIGALPEELTFTSGATESNNLVLKGVAQACQAKGRHIISCQTEHKSVLDTLMSLQRTGQCSVTLLPVDQMGQVSSEQVANAIESEDQRRTVLVSLMGANNEIGSTHPIEKIGPMLRSRGILFHVDAAQTAGKFAMDVKSSCIDFLSLSGHKLYGPKGIGALYIRKGLCENEVIPLLHGGGQERGLRPGTLPVPLVVALGEAARIAHDDMESETAHLSSLRIKLWQGLQVLGGVKLNGHPSQRIPGNLSVTFSGVDGERLQISLKQIAVSSTSACSAGAGHPSHVLHAIGCTDEEATATIRFGIGRFNTTAEIDDVIAHVSDVVTKLRKSREKKTVSRSLGHVS